jgi:hypothetical protein
LNSKRTFSVRDRNPTCGLSKLSDADFRGEFVRFEFNDVSATIDNNRPIFRLIDHVTLRALA